MKIYFSSLKGLRDQNEDKHNIISNADGINNSDNLHYLAIFDGHGGQGVSKFLHKNLHPYFTNRRCKYPLTKDYVNKVYDNVQKSLTIAHKDLSYRMGSTSLVAVYFEKNNKKYLNIINSGDCRCVLNRNNIAIALTKDHKPFWPEERERIEQIGGKIYFDGDDWRINDLSVSRSFGDVDSTPFVTHKPDLFKYKLSSGDKFIIMACDGLWDVVTNQEAVNFVLTGCYNGGGKVRNKTINIAKKLGEYALAKGSMDNVTVIVSFLD